METMDFINGLDKNNTILFNLNINKKKKPKYVRLLVENVRSQEGNLKELICSYHTKFGFEKKYKITFSGNNYTNTLIEKI